MVAAHLHLVHGVVAQLCRRLPGNVHRGDLLSAGVFGLVVALRRNGGPDGARFEGYARTHIRGAVFDELRAQDWLSRRARDRATAAQRAGGIVPRLVDIDEAVGDALPAPDDPAAIVEVRSELEALARAVERLPDRERRVVAMHYFDGAKLKQIGAELGVSEPRVSQLHARAIVLLRTLLEADEHAA
jgi:RNA polymerase sigma factor for flagellar operon FliA